MMRVLMLWGGIVTSRLYCTNLNICEICWESCPGCGETEGTEPAGEIEMTILQTEPRRQLFPEPVRRVTWLDDVALDQDQGQIFHNDDDSSDDSNNEVEIHEVDIHGNNTDNDDDISVHSSMPSLASSSSASVVSDVGNFEDFEDFDYEDMTGGIITEYELLHLGYLTMRRYMDDIVEEVSITSNTTDISLFMAEDERLADSLVEVERGVEYFPTTDPPSLGDSLIFEGLVEDFPQQSPPTLDGEVSVRDGFIEAVSVSRGSEDCGCVHSYRQL